MAQANGSSRQATTLLSRTTPHDKWHPRKTVAKGIVVEQLAAPDLAMSYCSPSLTPGSENDKADARVILESALRRKPRRAGARPTSPLSARSGKRFADV